MHFNTKPFLFLLISVSFLSLTSCHLFESTIVPKSEIVAASKWSDKDQYPKFGSFEGLEPEEEKECFESVITSVILDYISEQGWIASANIDTEVNLNLLVDQDGMISMSSLDAPDYVIEAIPNLEATLYEAINLIPQAEAGVKTNVGVLVTTSFTLPLRIFAQE